MYVLPIYLKLCSIWVFLSKPFCLCCEHDMEFCCPTMVFLNIMIAYSFFKYKCFMALLAVCTVLYCVCSELETNRIVHTSKTSFHTDIHKLPKPDLAG